MRLFLCQQGVDVSGVKFDAHIGHDCFKDVNGQKHLGKMSGKRSEFPLKPFRITLNIQIFQAFSDALFRDSANHQPYGRSVTTEHYPKVYQTTLGRQSPNQQIEKIGLYGRNGMPLQLFNQGGQKKNLLRNRIHCVQTLANPKKYRGGRHFCGGPFEKIELHPHPLKEAIRGGLSIVPPSTEASDTPPFKGVPNIPAASSHRVSNRPESYMPCPGA